MNYLYGNFSYRQITYNVKFMHGKVHKLLLYKDKNIKQTIFRNEVEFNNYFINLLLYFNGLNKLLGEPEKMIPLMATLQSAYELVLSTNFNYKLYRKLILDAHGLIKSMFEEECVNA